MAKLLQIHRVAALVLALLISTVARSQVVEFTVIQHHNLKEAFNSQGGRLLQGNTLPFWDDFSAGMDTLKWSFSGASFSGTIGLNAPSYGAVLLDGVAADGSPYSLTPTSQGESDTLASKPFDLSLLSNPEKESLYLSFFWQAGGRAELPDDNDQLSLQIFSPEGVWMTIWSQFGGAAVDRSVFSQEILQVLPEWQHENFQFRFLTEGRQSGPFDSWLIDYVFLNTNRTSSDTTYRDRSLTQPNHLRLGEYGAYPLVLLNEDQEGAWSTVQNEFYNLEDRFRAMEYSISILDSSTQSSIPINANTPFNPVPNSLERRVFESRELENLSLPENETTLKIITSLTSGDDPFYTLNAGDTTFFPSVDYRLNDTVATDFPLHDYFAYDNGSADYAAGINQRSGELAIKFNSPEPVYLKGISINFTNPKQANQAVDILVWNDLEKQPIFRREDLIAVKEEGQELLYYSLDTNIQVSGDFFIGYAQYTNDFIHVGLDKVNDTADKIFYNIVGEWQQNEEVKGALMIRPHISLDPPFEDPEAPETGVILYPNPVESQLNIEGKFTDIRIFDSFGREIFLEREESTKGEIVNFNGQRPGIYIINAMKEDGVHSYRILVK